MNIGQKRIKQQLDTIDHYTKIMMDRRKRIEQGLTDVDDCFISERSNQHAITEAKLKLEILQNGGLSKFEVLVDVETNDIVSKKIIQGKYGLCWIVNDDHADKFGRFVGLAKKESTYSKKGLKVEWQELPAWVCFNAGSGSGMMGMYTGAYQMFPSSKNYFTEK